MDDATYSLDLFLQISFEELLWKALLLFGCPAFISSWSRKCNPTSEGQYLSFVCNMLVSSVCLHFADKLAINCIIPGTSVLYWLCYAQPSIMYGNWENENVLFRVRHWWLMILNAIAIWDVLILVYILLYTGNGMDDASLLLICPI